MRFDEAVALASEAKELAKKAGAFGLQILDEARKTAEANSNSSEEVRHSSGESSKTSHELQAKVQRESATVWKISDFRQTQFEGFAQGCCAPVD